MNIRISEYNNLINKYTKQLAGIKSIHAIVSILRLVVFFCIALSFYFAFSKNQTIGIISGVSFLVIFLWLIKKHKNVEDKKIFAEKILEVNQHEKKACEGNYNNFDAGKEFIDTKHPYSYDIDLFGENSLFQYLNRTVTILGKTLLAKWLTQTPMPVNEIKENQDANKELSEKLNFRQEFLSIGKIYSSDKNEIDTIKKWLDFEAFFKHKTYLKILLYTLPIINISILILAVFGIVAWKFIALQIAVNLTIVGFKIKKFNNYYALLSQSNKHLRKMSRLLKIIEKQTFKTTKLHTLHTKLFKEKQSANKQINQLTKYLDALDNRNNLLVGILLNSYLLWDWQCIYRIENWQKKHNADFNNWLQALSEYDALISLANCGYNNPDFCYPKFADADFEFVAKQIGHPLLPKKDRVCNDFDLNSQQRYAIVTGANMAGKSTFLRTIAVNIILAEMGAVVCANELIITPLPLFSGMRTEDSLSGNESYFFAELKRLQQITQELDSGKKMFVILDEILRGTNSEDKRKGSIGFITKIIKKQAYGLIATHDLELARLSEQQPNIFKAMCFEVLTKNNKLQFDYKLQQGVTKNMNASFLMKQMGIIDE